MREGEDAAGDAIRRLLHQLLLLLALLLQLSQPSRLFLFQELPQLLKRPPNLLLRGLSLILQRKEQNESIQNIFLLKLDKPCPKPNWSDTSARMLTQQQRLNSAVLFIP